MPMRIKYLALFMMLACICSLSVAPGSTHAQLTPAEKERVREERAIRREIQREWNAEEWRRHNERFFGPGVIIERYPGEAYDKYVIRMHARCKEQLSVCLARCNAIADPLSRSSCNVSCDNDHIECNAGY